MLARAPTVLLVNKAGERLLGKPEAEMIGQPASAQPEALRGVGIDQRLDQQVPLDLTFRNESGAAVALGSLFRGKPVILNLVYYKCPMLCTLVLNGLLSATSGSLAAAEPVR